MPTSRERHLPRSITIDNELGRFRGRTPRPIPRLRHRAVLDTSPRAMPRRPGDALQWLAIRLGLQASGTSRNKPPSYLPLGGCAHPRDRFEPASTTREAVSRSHVKAPESGRAGNPRRGHHPPRRQRARLLLAWPAPGLGPLSRGSKRHAEGTGIRGSVGAELFGVRAALWALHILKEAPGTTNEASDSSI